MENKGPEGKFADMWDKLAEEYPAETPLKELQGKVSDLRLNISDVEQKKLTRPADQINKIVKRIEKLPEELKEQELSTSKLNKKAEKLRELNDCSEKIKEDLHEKISDKEVIKVDVGNETASIKLNEDNQRYWSSFISNQSKKLIQERLDKVIEDLEDLLDKVSEKIRTTPEQIKSWLGVIEDYLFDRKKVKDDKLGLMISNIQYYLYQKGEKKKDISRITSLLNHDKKPFKERVESLLDRIDPKQKIKRTYYLLFPEEEIKLEDDNELEMFGVRFYPPGKLDLSNYELGYEYHKDTYGDLIEDFMKDQGGMVACSTDVEATGIRQRREKAFQKIDKAIDILRLRAPKRRILPPSSRTKTDFLVADSDSENIYSGGTRQTFRTIPYEIDPDEKENIMKHLDELDFLIEPKTEIEKSIKKSIHWFGVANYSNAKEDKFLNYYVALESLLTDGPKEQMRGGKLGKRVVELARVLGDYRKRVSRQMEDIYGLRCKVVHGGHYGRELEEIMPVLRSYTKKCINKAGNLIKEEGCSSVEELKEENQKKLERIKENNISSSPLGEGETAEVDGKAVDINGSTIAEVTLSMKFRMEERFAYWEGEVIEFNQKGSFEIGSIKSFVTKDFDRTLEFKALVMDQFYLGPIEQFGPVEFRAHRIGEI